ncbi:hypothetical protein LWC35_13255 [Pseudonocardia kujensis]|uniref:hypothetical protein n=1 Tax=Pseudonocardia kujensis TaxID=1128675 RepID=UPI001E56B5D5|nr:hypothetical protein [Pseudonocardia kujensis]MCE0763869.1 hypothetical protein [Pseudonocardia kujensis]
MTALETGDEAPRSGNGTRPADPGPAERRDAAVADLKQSLRDLLRTVLRSSVGLVLEHVEDLGGTIQKMATSGGLAMGGLLGGVRAGLAGKNPIWGALKGAVGAMSTGMRVAIILALVLAILLLPITVVLLLVALIVLIIVAAAKAGS